MISSLIYVVDILSKHNRNAGIFCSGCQYFRIKSYEDIYSGVRFINRRGLNEKQIYRISELLHERLSGGVNLIGMDLTEFNPRSADPSSVPSGDRTYRIAANLIRKLCFGLKEI